MTVSYTTALLFVSAILLAVVLEENKVDAVTCNPLQLNPCLDAVKKGSRPSPLCCRKVKEQQPCICGYLKNPTLKAFLYSPNAKNIAKICRSPYPKC